MDNDGPAENDWAIIGFMYRLRSIAIPILAIIGFTGAGAVSLSAQTGSLCNLFKSGDLPPAGYGAPWSPISPSKTLHLNSYCSGMPGQPVTYSVGDGNQLYIYQVGYFYTDKWNSFTMSGTLAEDTTDWFKGNGKFTNPAPPPQDHFWVGFLCGWSGTGWQCGCRDAACTTPYWQLQGVTYPGSGGSTGGGTGSCDASKWNGVPCPPEPPRSYPLPTGALRVMNSTELKNALSGGTARDIILENGTYDNSTYFHVNAAHRLWAATLGGATLKAGLLFNKAAGSEVHGIRFYVSSNGKTADESIISIREAAHRLTITDSWFDGNMDISRGIHYRAVHGVRMQRLVVTRFQMEGIFVTDLRSFGERITPIPPPYISDIDVSYIRHSDPKCCNGRSEFGISLGNSAKGALVERVKCRYADWSCIIPVRLSHGTHWRDIDLDYTNDHAFYFEHWADDNILERFRIGPNVQSGIAFEGASDGWGWRGGANNNLIKDGIIETSRLGINIGSCNGKNLVDRVAFIGQCHAGIVNNSHITSKCTPTGPSVFTNNDYSRIDAGAKQVLVNGPSSGASLCGHWDPWK